MSTTQLPADVRRKRLADDLEDLDVVDDTDPDGIRDNWLQVTLLSPHLHTEVLEVLADHDAIIVGTNKDTICKHDVRVPDREKLVG